MFFSPFLPHRLPCPEQGALDQPLIASVREHPTTDQGTHSAKGEDADPGKGIVHKGQIDIHSIESGYKGREHQADGDNGQPLHDDIHIIADDRGKSIHRSRKN